MSCKQIPKCVPMYSKSKFLIQKSSPIHMENFHVLGCGSEIYFPLESKFLSHSPITKKSGRYFEKSLRSLLAGLWGSSCANLTYSSESAAYEFDILLEICVLSIKSNVARYGESSASTKQIFGALTWEYQALHEGATAQPSLVSLSSCSICSIY